MQESNCFDADVLDPNQRKRDGNKNKICAFQGGGVGRKAERKIVQNTLFHGKRHDNKISKSKMLLSRNFVVMAQAPTEGVDVHDPRRSQKNVMRTSLLISKARKP